MPNPAAPFIFLAFANPNIGRYSELPRLVEEARQLRILFKAEEEKDKSICQLILLENAVLQDVFDEFKKRHHYGRIAVFHFAGHADSHTLLLESAQREALFADAAGFADFLVDQSGLHLVFLNGCSTQEQVEGLHKAGVKVVVATIEDVADELALPFAVSFYKGLAGGMSIAAAYRAAKGEARSVHGQQEEWPWLMFPPSGKATEWKLADAIYAPKTAPTNMAKSPPEDFVERPTEYNDLRDFLCASGPDTELPIAAIVGMGGCGKTTLAQRLCHDPQVIEHFPDGILWSDVNENPGELTSRLLDLVFKLTGRRPDVKGENTARDELKQALGDKRLLLVIDNVWQADHLAWFLEGGEHCTRLVTTRTSDVLPKSTHIVRLGMMNSDEAVQLIGDDLPDGESTQLKALATRLGEWPLLLRIVNGVLREFIEGGEAKAKAIADVDELLTESGLTAFDEPNNPQMRDQSLAAIINASLKLLSDQERSAFWELAIFPQGVDIPLATTARAWSMKPAMTKLLAVRLNKLSLLRHWELENGGTLRLHDVVRTYLRETMSSDLAAHNGRFLDSYKLTDWTKLDQSEPYLWNWLAYHLLEAERSDALAGLFADDKWMHARVAYSNYIYDGFVADLNIYWHHCHARALQEIDQGGCTLLAECVRCALIATSVNSLSADYVPELVVRALETDLEGWTGSRALSVASRVPDPQRRFEFLTRLTSTGLLDAEQTAGVLQWRLDAAMAISYGQNRAQALATLAPELSGDLLERVVEEALNLAEESDKALALRALGPHLNTDLLQHALDVVQCMVNDDYKALALKALPPQLSDALQVRILNIALQISSSWNRANVLEALVPRLSDDLLPEALNVALSLDRGAAQAKALSALSPRLSNDLLSQVLEMVLNFGSEEAQAKALAALVPQLDGDLLSQALETVLNFDSGEARADALVALTPQLNGDLLQTVLNKTLLTDTGLPQAEVLAALARRCGEQFQKTILDAAMMIDNDSAQAKVLVALVPTLSIEFLQTAVDAALKLEDRRSCAETLVALAPRLSDDLLQRVIDVTLENILGGSLRLRPDYEEREWIEVLAALAPRLSDESLEQMVATVETIDDISLQAAVLTVLASQADDKSERILGAATKVSSEWARARVLVALAPQTSDELLPQILEATQNIRDSAYRADVLKALAPHVSGDCIRLALDATLDIGDAKPRADILADLAPKLSGNFLQRGLDATLDIGDRSVWPATLATLASQLKEEARANVLRHGLAGACKIDDDELQANVLVTVVSHLTTELAQPELNAALSFQDSPKRGKVLTALVPQLSDDLLSNALDAALDLDDEYWRAETLAALAPRIDDESHQKVLDAILVMGDDGAQAKVRAALAPRVNDDLLQKAFDTALAMAKSQSSNAIALVALTPRLNEVDQRRALATVLTISNAWIRAKALAALVAGAKHLDEKDRDEAFHKALEAGRNIDSDRHRAEVLYALGEGVEAFTALVKAMSWTPKLAMVEHMAVWAPRLIGVVLEEELSDMNTEDVRASKDQRISASLKECFETLQIDDKLQQARILTIVATQHSGDVRDQAVRRGLEVARSISDIPDAMARPIALASFMAVTPDSEGLPAEVRKFVANYLLDEFSKSTRWDLLKFISVKEIFTPPIFNEDTLVAIANHIIEITGDWKWA